MPDHDAIDAGQVAALLGISRTRVDRMIDAGILTCLHAGDLIAWQAHDRAQRRAALVSFASAVDREIFG